MFPWATFQKYVNYALIGGAVILTFILIFFGATRRAEHVGKVKEQLRSKVNAEKVKDKFDAVPRPERSDVVDKLRDGKF